MATVLSESVLAVNTPRLRPRNSQVRERGIRTSDTTILTLDDEGSIKNNPRAPPANRFGMLRVKGLRMYLSRRASRNLHTFGHGCGRRLQIYRLLALLFTAVLWGCLNMSALAQESGPDQATGAVTKPAPVEQETPDEKQKKEEEKKKSDEQASRGSFVAAPVPIVSPAVGTGVIPALGYIFPFSRRDKVSPPSVVGVGGLFTNNGSRGFAVAGQLFMKEDTYEITSVYIRGNIDYNLYGPGLAGNPGLKLPLEQTGQAFFGEVLRRVWWKFFLGPRLSTGDSFLTLRPNDGNIPSLPPDLGIHTTLRAMGIHLLRDTRPNHFFPTAGTKFELTSDFFAKGLGSKYSFQSYKLYFDKYWSLSKNQVLAYDLFACSTGGSPPFYGNCIYGTHNELRGYVAGQYLDRYMTATQLEYRLSLPKRFGLAAFGGIGEVIPGKSQIFRNSDFLPSVGGGPRFELSPKYHLNLRADFAKGKDSWTWGVGVGEAF